MFSGKERALKLMKVWNSKCILTYEPHSFLNFIISLAGKVILRKETTSIDSLTTNRLSPNALTSVVPLMIVNRRLRLQCVDRLTKIMCAILESYASEDRRHVDYVAISKCEEFRRYVTYNTLSCLWMQNIPRIYSICMLQGCMTFVSLCTTSLGFAHSKFISCWPIILSEITSLCELIMNALHGTWLVLGLSNDWFSL